ncbi:YidC/Oxa1 family membrane protein insertase [Parvibaculum indicum]|uniref:membrane protein insertase YidC n=1 Tax=Parvibaculum indicum TaxID=562969 RepID=UPI00141EF641|nr:membrane protein insertase YidC [Parvibaculum indicum]NIJ40835.1 YidC/Oxa1 family membrane protein insertase [Parvibaculum indicum]
MGDNRNFIIAIALSVLVFVGWQYFFINPKMEAEKAQKAAQQAAQTQQSDAGSQSDGHARPPAIDGSAPRTPATSGLSAETVTAQGPRIDVSSDRLDGSISLSGVRFDDLKLRNYHETIADDSPEVRLFSPVGTKHPYFSEFGWIAPPNSGIATPGAKTLWTVEGNDTLTPTTPVDLVWDNGQGLVFHREISLDENYMFTVKDSVDNKTGAPVTLYPYGLISRNGQPSGHKIYILHEGLIGALDSEGLLEVDYGDVKDEPAQSYKANDGWLGITDKYWAAALIPQKGRSFDARFSEAPDPAKEIYQADFRYDAVTIPASATQTITNKLFAGAKVVNVVDGYRDQGVYKFDLMIDWGWFWFLTKPMFQALHFFANIVGNFGVAILIVTVLVKLAFFPLANRSYVVMSKMKMLQPKMKELQERYAEDKMKQQQEIMELYKKEQVNPLAGCLPILIQIPVFFALYKVLYVTIEMRHAPFFGWIHDLSAPDPTTIFNLFGLIPWTPPSMLMIGAWPLIMGVTMFMQQRMNPAPADPIQQQIFTWMPVIFTVMLAGFPAGLVIYWAWNNSLSVLQQGVIMKRQGVKIEIFSNLGFDRLFGGSGKS